MGELTVLTLTLPLPGPVAGMAILLMNASASRQDDEINT